MRLKISGGRLFDPAASRHGEVRDLYVDGGRMVPHLSRVDRVIEARDRLVAPGGIDLRGQVATYGLNFRRGAGGLPTVRELGERYAALGYTHVHEPFLTLYTANYVHCQLAALPVVDTSASLVLNLRDLDLWLASPDRRQEIKETVAFFLDRTRALNLRVVEPRVRYRQEFYAHRQVPGAAALEVLADLARVQQVPLNLEAASEVLRAELPEPRAFHLAALGPALREEELLEAALRQLQQGASADMGLMDPFGAGQAGADIRVDLGWFEPLNLSPSADKDAARRALGLALQYQGEGLAFSGAAASVAGVEAFPRLFSWLGNRLARRRDWGEDLGSREYSVSQWVWATRVLPARLLGLTDRGSLRAGARADVAIYDPAPGAAGQWPGRCCTLLKAGEMVVENYTLINPEVARATYFRSTEAQATPLVEEICQYRSFRPENLWVQPELEVEWKQV